MHLGHNVFYWVSFLIDQGFEIIPVWGFTVYKCVLLLSLGRPDGSKNWTGPSFAPCRHFGMFGPWMSLSCLIAFDLGHLFSVIGSWSESWLMSENSSRMFFLTAGHGVTPPLSGGWREVENVMLTTRWLTSSSLCNTFFSTHVNAAVARRQLGLTAIKRRVDLHAPGNRCHSVFLPILQVNWAKA